MNMTTDILVVQSARGAAGAFLLQLSCGLFFFYMLVASAESLRVNFSLINLNAITGLIITVGLLPFLTCLQSVMLAELRTADIFAALREWPSDRRERRRALAVPPLCALYAVLLVRPGWLGLPEPGLVWSLTYQLFSAAAVVAMERDFPGVPASEAGGPEKKVYSQHPPRERKAIVNGFLFAGALGAAAICVLCVVDMFTTIFANMLPPYGLLFITVFLFMFGLTAVLTDDFER